MAGTFRNPDEVCEVRGLASFVLVPCFDWERAQAAGVPFMECSFRRVVAVVHCAVVILTTHFVPCFAAFHSAVFRSKLAETILTSVCVSVCVCVCV